MIFLYICYVSADIFYVFGCKILNIHKYKMALKFAKKRQKAPKSAKKRQKAPKSAKKRQKAPKSVKKRQLGAFCHFLALFGAF